MLTTDVENTYRVFSDNLFNNSTARLTAKVWCPYKVPDPTDWKYEEEYLTDEENALAGIFYNWHLTVKLQSISEQQYYYLRAMNAITSSAYDELSSLTGAMKVPTNVHGGSGNFSVSTQTTVTLTVIDNYRLPYKETIYMW